MMTHDETFEYWRGLDPKTREHIRWRFYGSQSKYDWDNSPRETAIDCIPILDHGYVALLDHMGTDIDIVNAARKSFNKECTFFDHEDRQLLMYMWNNGHTSPFEMVELKFAVKCPIFIARQWMRHRTWSYNEVSRRYTDENIDTYILDPEWIRRQSENDRQASVKTDDFEPGVLTTMKLQGHRDTCYSLYQKLLADGVCREQARMVLPQATYTEFIAKVDLSNLLKFINLRMDSHAQWEIQQYAEAIAEMLITVVPETMNIVLGEEK